jgi:acyl transferase domain-containing protein
MIVLSAKNTTRLKEQALRIAKAIREQGFSQGDLERIAYTLQVGREAMDERIGFLASSIQEVEQTLQHYATDITPSGVLYQGQAGHNRETFSTSAIDEALQDTVNQWIQRGKYENLLQLWINGLALDWNILYKEQPRRISLPGYPFAREQYWVPTMTGNTKLDFTGKPIRSNAHGIVAGHAPTTETVTTYPETFTSTMQSLKQRIKASIKPLQVSTRANTPEDVEHSELLQWLQDNLRAEISYLFEVDVDNIDISMDLNEYDFDPIKRVALSNWLSQQYQIEVSPHTFIEYPTVSSLSLYLIETYKFRLVPYFQRIMTTKA